MPSLKIVPADHACAMFVMLKLHVLPFLDGVPPAFKLQSENGSFFVVSTCVCPSSESVAGTTVVEYGASPPPPPPMLSPNGCFTAHATIDAAAAFVVAGTWP